MARFRKKPVEIEAVRNDGEWNPIVEWLDELAGGTLRIPFGMRPRITRNDNGSLDIATLEGTMRADVGDWVICGVQGELYPCKPEIFDKTYEAAGEKPEESLSPEYVPGPYGQGSA